MPQPAKPPPLSTAELRAREFPVTGRALYLNAASMGILPQRAQRALDDFTRRHAWLDELRDPDFSAPLVASRAAAARLVNAAPEEIALGPNTSFGINLAAHALPVERGSCVVVSDREFPANVYPWMRSDALRLEIVPTDGRGRPDMERILERLDRGDASIFALSAVQFASGYRADLEALGRFCAERGIFFVVDAIQAAGQVPIDVRAARIDVLATGGHKWLCAPFGTGFTYVRRELIPQLEPRVVGWTAMKACQDLTDLLAYRYEFLDDARRFEVATQPLPNFAGFAEAVGLLLEVGVERIEAHLADALEPLYRWLAERSDVAVLSDLEPARRSAIVSFRPPAAERVYAELRAAGIICVLREGSIRLSPHLYNTREEIERVVDVMERSGGRP